MSRILLVGGNLASETLSAFAGGVSSQGRNKVICAASGQEALAIMDGEKVNTVVVDEELADGDGLPFVRELMKVNPLINCALISSLSPDDFHEATEGLGVFMQLPANPETEHADKMLELLESIEVLMNF